MKIVTLFVALLSLNCHGMGKARKFCDKNPSLCGDKPAPAPIPVPVPTPVPTPVPEPTPVVSQDPIDLSKMDLQNLGRADLKKSIVDKKALSAKLYGHKKVDMTFEPINWARGNGALKGEHFCVGWIEGNVFYAVMVDWSIGSTGYTSKSRGLGNLIPGPEGNGVSNGHLPPSGADFYVFLVSNDGKLRTTIISSGKW